MNGQPLRGISMWRRLLGTLPLLVGLGGSLVLALEQLMGLTLRGCGPQSGCAELAAGSWGSVAGWPVSYIGLAWFAGLTLAWWTVGGGVGSALRWSVRAGSLGSLGFLLLMLLEGQFCLYCLVVHLGQFGFLAVVETSPRASVSRPAPLAALIGGLAVVSLVLGAARLQVERRVVEQARQQTDQAVEEILASPAAPDAGSREEDRGLTGRWRLGPEIAPVRLVVLGGYQCGSCQDAEQELEPFLGTRDDVSIAFRHFPLCRDCNRTIKHPRFHDHACRAARAAEAAGILDGNDGFWRMHHWLFSRRGRFTDEELRDALPDLGFSDFDGFVEVMNGPRALRGIESDVEEGIALGIDGTPLVFINGVEVSGADVEGNLTAAITRLLDENLPPASPASDQPRGRNERLAAVWAEQEVIDFAAEPRGWVWGADEAPHELTLVLDYANPYSVWLDELSRTLATERDCVRYRVIVFPLSRELNPRFADWEEDIYGPSAPMARLTAAVGQLGDSEAFWTMHRWVLANQDAFDLETALQAAAAAGLDPQEVRRQMDSPEVQVALRDNIAALEAREITWAGNLYLNGRQITAMIPSRNLLERILDEADESPAARKLPVREQTVSPVGPGVRPER